MNTRSFKPLIKFAGGAEEGLYWLCTDYGCIHYASTETAHTITSRMDRAGNDLLIEISKTMEQGFITPSQLDGKKIRIRKITPRECFRLMGVADSDIDKILSVVANSPAYMLAGNSIVAGGNYTDNEGNVDGVLYNIFRKLLIETDRDESNHPEQLTLF